MIDAAQGVEAQTLAVCYMAIEQNLEVLPVLNKIDLPQADPERAAQEIEDIIGIDADNIFNFLRRTLRISLWQINFVKHRQHF